VTEPEYQPETDNNRQIFDVFEELRKLPDQSDSMLTDVYFSDFPGASSRIFRIYRGLPPHYHEECDEHLYVVSGRGLFHLDGQEAKAGPGTFGVRASPGARIPTHRRTPVRGAGDRRAPAQTGRHRVREPGRRRRALLHGPQQLIGWVASAAVGLDHKDSRLRPVPRQNPRSR
jgi:hypothetical protein